MSPCWVSVRYTLGTQLYTGCWLKLFQGMKIGQQKLITVGQARNIPGCSASSVFDLPVWGNLCIMVGSGAGSKDQSARQELYLNNKKAPA